MTQFRSFAFSGFGNLGYLLLSDMFKSLSSSSPSLRSGRSSSLWIPLDLQCYPSPVVAEGIDPKLPTIAICLLLVWHTPDSAIWSFPNVEFGRSRNFCSWKFRIHLLSLSTLPKSTRTASPNLPPQIGHIPISPKFRPTPLEVVLSLYPINPFVF